MFITRKQWKEMLSEEYLEWSKEEEQHIKHLNMRHRVDLISRIMKLETQLDEFKKTTGITMRPNTGGQK